MDFLKRTSFWTAAGVLVALAALLFGSGVLTGDDSPPSRCEIGCAIAPQDLKIGANEIKVTLSNPDPSCPAVVVGAEVNDGQGRSWWPSEQIGMRAGAQESIVHIGNLSTCTPVVLVEDVPGSLTANFGSPVLRMSGFHELCRM